VAIPFFDTKSAPAITLLYSRGSLSSSCDVAECRQGGIGSDAVGREARERAAHQGEVPRGPRQTERYPQLRRRQQDGLIRAEAFEGSRADERPVKRQTQVACLGGRQHGPFSGCHSSKRFGMLTSGERNTTSDRRTVDQAGFDGEGAGTLTLSARPADSTASADRIASPTRIGP